MAQQPVQAKDESLLAAAAAGDVSSLTSALRSGADANAADSSGATALMWAAYSGSEPSVRALLAAGADPTKKGIIWLGDQSAFYGSTLAAAAGEGWLPVVRFLVDEGVIPVDDREWNPRDDAETGWTALQWAVSADQVAVVRYLAQSGADLSVRNRAGEPLLLTVAERGRLPMVRALLESGVDPNAADADGNTPLLFAMSVDALEVAELLINYGADPNAEGMDGLTPLLFGIATYSTASTLALMETDVDVNRRDSVGQEPIHWASMGGVTEIVAQLLNRGADPNATDQYGTTPLINAAQNRRAGVGKLLLDRGADPNVREVNDWTALYHATRSGDTDFMRILIDAGAEIDATTEDGLRALDVAIDSLINPPIEMLVCAGASLTQRDPDGRLPLERAKAREREDAVRSDYADDPLTFASDFLSDPFCGPTYPSGWVENNELFMANGSVVAARIVYDGLLSSDKNRLGREQPGYAYLFAQSLWTRIESGDVRGGQAIGEDALALHQRLYSDDAPELALVFAPLASLFSKSDRERSRTYVMRGLELGASVNDNLLLPRLYRTKAELDLADGDPASAASAAQQAIDLVEADSTLFASVRRRELVRAERLLAEAAESIGEVDYAGEVLRRSVGRLTDVKFAHYATGLLADLARHLIQHERDSSSTAFDLALRAADFVQKYLAMNLSGLSQAELTALLNREVYPLSGLLLSTARSGEDFRRAYAYLHTQKGLLMQALRFQARTLSSEDGVAFEMYGKRNDLRELRRRIARESVAAQVNASRLDSLTQRKEAFERDILKNQGKPHDPVTDSTLSDFRRLFARNELMVDFYRYDQESGMQSESRYGAFIVHNSPDDTDGTQHAISWVDLGPSEAIDVLVQDWLERISRGGHAEEERDALQLALWDPLVTSMPASVSRIWISPDGSLARVPWTVLSEGQSETASRLLSVIDSPREFARLRKTRRRELSRAEERAILLVGGVDFSSADDSAGATSILFEPLPGTETELASIYAVARSERRPVHVITGPDATRTVVTDRLQSARYAHLATHGFFFRESESAYRSRGAKASRVLQTREISRNPLIESGLALAGANRSSDGLLTAEELIGLDLSGTQLVVLSACDTGRGAEITGQGVMGLRAALTAAGVRSMLMSLWKVPDESTAILMEAFYRALLVEQLSPAEALRKAQAVVRENPLFAAPVYWAAWVLAGEIWDR